MSKIQLKNVRLSFPSLFRQAEFNGEKGKYEATFFISKAEVEVKKQLDAAIAQVLADEKMKCTSDKLCLKDGDDATNDSAAGYWTLKASSAKRPTVIDRDKTPLTEEDEKLYAGCYVNAIIDLWGQNNSYGKRVNANLYGVQFVKDGEPFGSGPVDVTDEFEDLDDL